MKTIKVIDLLNKIANGEHDFEFKYCDLEYFWDFSSKAFIDTEEKMTLGERWEIDNILNDEVEIIEKNKKIEKLDTSKYFYVGPYTENQPKRYDIDVFNKINEIINYINKEGGNNDMFS